MKDDTISRAAALDALGEEPPVWYDGEDEIAERNQWRRDVAAIKALPSATDTNVGGNLSVDELITFLNPESNYVFYDDSHGFCINTQDVLDHLCAMPSAQLAQDLPNTCTDAIGRQAAVETVRKAKDKSEAHRMLIQLPSAQPGWIPCDRELPKPNEEDGNGFYKAYLVQDGRWMDVARWDGKYWVAWGYSTVLLNVVAWMPLPAPYIPEGDDKHEG